MKASLSCNQFLLKKGLLLFLLFVMLSFVACQKSGVQQPAPAANEMYFPPVSGTSWESISPASLGWNEGELNNLYAYLGQKRTKAFIVLKDGKIAAERYYHSFTADSTWYWASAGKTMTAFLIGIAQHEGFLNINTKTSEYIGRWTALPMVKEDMITIRHQLTMTTGIDDGLPDSDCTLPPCLQYKADAGKRWAYHNAPYTVLEKVVEAATGTTYNSYFQQKIRDKIGMNGLWIKAGYNNVYFSTPRSMARFGLLLLNKGVWNESAILADSNYFNMQVNTSQNINPSYGLLTWLNGKGPVSFVPNAPADMYAALGKNDQKIYVVPSLNVVVIRMGEDAGNDELPSSGFNNELWGKLKLVMKY